MLIQLGGEKMPKDLAKLVEELTQKALVEGADEAEAFAVNSRELNIHVAHQKIDNLKLAEERGIGIRVIKNKRMGYSFSSDLSDTALGEVVHQAIMNSTKTGEDQYLSLPKIQRSYPQVEIFDPQITQVSVDEKIEFAKKIEVAARGYDERVKITEKSAYQDSTYELWLNNSHGVSGYYQGAYCGGYSLVVGQEGEDNQTGFGMQYKLKYDQLQADLIGKEAAQKAVRMLGAKSIKSQKAPIVLDPYIATNFLGLVAHAINGEAVQKGKSFLKNKVDQQVASSQITIIDDGTLQGGIMSSAFDGEGVPTSKTIVIKNGKLVGYLHNTYTAAKEGVESTGNGIRGSYRGTPEVGTTNFYIEAGQTPVEKLLGLVTKGLYITDVMGMHTANPISGDFSLGVSGLWIENGQFTYPVRGVAIAGNIKDLLMSVSDIGNDLEFFVGKGAPTILIDSIAISGT